MFTDLALGLILIDILSNIAHWLLVSVFVLGFFAMMFMLVAESFGNGAQARPFIKKFFIFAAPAMVVVALVPSEQTLYIALGLHATGVVATQVAESEVGKKALTALEVKLDEIIEQAPAPKMEESE